MMPIPFPDEKALTALLVLAGVGVLAVAAGVVALAVWVARHLQWAP